MNTISQVNIAAYVFCVIFCLGIGVAFLVCLLSKNKKVETGMYAAVSIGGMGYVWGGLLFPIVLLGFVGNLKAISNLEDSLYLVYALCVSIVNGFFAVLALVWGIYLTNQKQNSYYRSAAIGIGYGLINAILVNGFPLTYAIQINQGHFAEGIAKKNMLAKSLLTIVEQGYTSGIYIVFYGTVSLFVATYFMKKKWPMVVAVGLGAVGGLNLIRIILEYYCTDAVYSISFMVIMTIVGGGCIYLLKTNLFDAKEFKKAPEKEYLA